MLRKRLRKYIPSSIYLLLDGTYLSWYRSLYSWFLRGNSYTCPLCHRSFKRLLTNGYKNDTLKEKKIIGGGRRKNVLCPFCTSTDRERLVFLFIQSRGLLQDRMHLLHIAPEKSLQKALNQKNILYSSADLDSPFAEKKMDVQQIPFPGGYFDAIICNHVLEHVPDDIKAINELYRVLKPGGWAILQVPYSPILEETFEDSSIKSYKERERVFGQSDHVRIYGLDYPRRLAMSGFTVSQERLDADTIHRFALLPDEAVFFCKKNA